MKKKALIVFLCLIFLCGNAFAQAERITLDLALRTETDSKHLTADLVSSDGEVLVLSDLFPSYAVSLPVSSVSGFPGIKSAIVSLTDLLRQDFTPPQSEWLSSLNPVTEKGVYSGDLFDYATQMQTLSLDLTDFLSQSGNTGNANNLHLFDHVFGISPVSLVIHVYDDGKYLSMSGFREKDTVFTVSCDFSVAGKKKIVWGYPENGRNYYWTAESAVLSQEDMELSCALYSDQLKRGFRDASLTTPVLRETWSVHTEGSDQLQLSAEITPGNQLDPILISCSVMDGISAEVQFGHSGLSCLSVSVKDNPEEIKPDGYQLISIEDLYSPSTAAAFTAEVSTNALPIFFYLMQILPQDYLNILLDLN